MKTPAEIARSIKEDLNQLVKYAHQLLNQSKTTVEAERKSKNLMRLKQGKYCLNPHRYGRLIPEEISDKQYRSQAREVERKLTSEFSNLLQDKHIAVYETQEISRTANCTLNNLQAMDEALTGLTKQVNCMEDRVKLFRYQRREELNLYEKIFGVDSAKAARKIKKIRSQIGDTEMAKKNAPTISELMSKLEKSKDSNEKRELRVQLRKLGHKGGLNTGRGRPKKVARKTAAKEEE